MNLLSHFSCWVRQSSGLIPGHGTPDNPVNQSSQLISHYCAHVGCSVGCLCGVNTVSVCCVWTEDVNMHICLWVFLR